MGRHLHSCTASEIPGDTAEVSPSLKNVFLIRFCPLADNNAVSDKSRGREAFGAATMHLPSTGLTQLIWFNFCMAAGRQSRLRLSLETAVFLKNSMAPPPVKWSAVLSVYNYCVIVTYNDWCLGQAKRRTLFQTATLFLCSQIMHCIEHYKKKRLYLKALHLIFYKPCLSPLKWGRKAWQRYLWKAAGPKESFTYFSGKKVLSWTAVDGGIDDLAIKTLVEELRDLDSIGQIFCLALGQLLWFVMPLVSCWKMGMAGLICLAGVQGDRWCWVLRL